MWIAKCGLSMPEEGHSMKDDDKTRNQLLTELEKLRRQLSELEESESRHDLSEEEHLLFKAIVESSKEAIAISDPHGQLIYVNQAHEKLFGRSLEEARQLNYRDYYPPESIEVLNRDVAPTLARGESWEGVLDAIDSKGGRFPLWERADTVRDAEGNMLCAFGIMHDVTDEVRVKESLRESEERFRLAFENANIGMCLVDTEGRLVKVNSQMCVIFGYSQQELEGMTVDSITHPEYLDVSPRFMQRASSGEITHAEFEKQYFHKEGHIVWGEVASSLVKDVEGSPLYFISHVKDITERKRAEEELRKRTHDLGERVKDLNCLFGISKVVERQDATWEEIFQEIVNLIPPAWQYPEITCARLMLEDQEFRTANFRETIWNQTKVITVDGEQIGTVEVCYLENTPGVDEGPFLREERSLIDAIAERLGRMIERKRNEERILELSRALVKVQEIERQEISRDLHDNLAQDLSSLKISLDTLLDDRPEFSFGDREKASELSRGVQRSIGYVRDMIYGLHPAGLEHLGLAETIRVYCEEFAAGNAKKVDFFSVGMGDLKLGFDTEIALYRLVQEGLANIEKHADANHITIRLSASFPHIILRIEDNGKGFNVQTRIFEALKEKRMGLQIMEQRVALLNGEMVIDSRPRLGTKILVKVPIRGKH
jgi:PAS domain S-box-containing protein